MISVYGDLKGENYKTFVSFAMEHSDAMMLIYCDYGYPLKRRIRDISQRTILLLCKFGQAVGVKGVGVASFRIPEIQPCITPHLGDAIDTRLRSLNGETVLFRKPIHRGTCIFLTGVRIELKSLHFNFYLIANSKISDRLLQVGFPNIAIRTSVIRPVRDLHFHSSSQIEHVPFAILHLLWYDVKGLERVLFWRKP